VVNQSPAATLSPVLQPNNRPIIGVLTQPDSERFPSLSYLETDYVHWIEGSGGRVVPLPYDASPELLSKLLSMVNGLLFTGGGLYLGFNDSYYNTSRFLFEWAQQAHDQGDYFPVWGTCQGFQLLCLLVAQSNETVLQVNAFDSENLGLALDLTEEAASSRLFSSIGDTATRILSSENVTMNLHQDGVDPQLFRGGNEFITSFFSLLSTNVDRRGKPFGSTMEARDSARRPIYGVQWHPERNAFDWDLPETALSHTADAIFATQSLARFLVDQARRNFHKFPSVEVEGRALIYNWGPFYSGKNETQNQDTQTYVFVDLPAHFEKLLL